MRSVLQDMRHEVAAYTDPDISAYHAMPHSMVCHWKPLGTESKLYMTVYESHVLLMLWVAAGIDVVLSEHAALLLQCCVQCNVCIC